MIQVITIAIAVPGAVLLIILFSLIQRANANLKLKKHRSRDAGLADLLNYAAVVDDGVIVGKNGSFMTSWFYRGTDNASATEAERELISFRINQAIAPLGNGWMLHVDAVRRPAPCYSDPSLSHFPDPVSAAIDEERRRLFENLGTLYEGFFIVTVTWFPPMLVERKFVELMFNDDADKPNHKVRTAHLIEHFKREVANLEGRLSAAVEIERLHGVKMVEENGSTMTHDQQLQWLQFCVTGLNHPVQLPSNPMYIDSLIGGISSRLSLLKAFLWNPIQASCQLWQSYLSNTAGRHGSFFLITTRPSSSSKNSAKNGSRKFVASWIRCSIQTAAMWMKMRFQW